MTCNLSYIIIENIYVYMQFKTITLNTRHQLHNYSTTLLREKMKNKNVYDTFYSINSKQHYIIVF